MVALASAFVRLRPDPDRTGFRRAGKEMGEEAGKAAGDSLPEGLKRGADGKVRDAQGRFVSGYGSAGERAGRAAGKGFSLGFGDGSSVFGKVAKIAGARLSLVGLGAAAATPGVIHLTSALLPAVGAINAAPIAVAGLVTALGTVKLAAAGTGEAIGKGLTGTTKQFEKALEDLPPSAQRFAKSVVALKPQIEGLRKIAASRLFRPLQDEVKPLANVLFPVLRKEVGDTAGRLGGLGEEFAKAARKAEVIQAIRDTFYATGQSAVILRAAVRPLITSFALLIQSTAGELPNMTKAITGAGVAFATFLRNAVESGRALEVYENAKQTLRDLGTIVVNIGSIIASVFGAANANGNTLLSTFADLTGQAAAFLRSAQGVGALGATFSVLGQFGEALRTSLGAVLPAIGESLQILAPAIGALAGPVAQLIVALSPLLPMLAGTAAVILTKLTPAISAIAGYLAQNTGLVTGLATAASVLFGVYRAGSIIMAVQAAGGLLKYVKTLPLVINLTRVWTATQALLNTALIANPIGLVIAAIAALVAGIVIAYKKSETFRNIVDAAWRGIKVAIAATVDWITGTVWPSLQRAWDQIAAGALWLWRNAIQPAWNGIKAVVDFVINAVKLYIRALVWEFNIIADAAMWLWRNIFSPVFAGIRKVIEVWWLATQIVFKLLANIITAVVGKAIEWLRTIWDAVFNFARLVIQRWWADVQRLFGLFRTYVLGPLASALESARAFFARVFGAISNTVRTWWQNNVQPVFQRVRDAWNALSGAFSAVYNEKIRPLFQKFTDFIKGPVVEGFRKGTDMIRAAWDKVREYARKPVAFVVNSVINPFIRGLNKVAGLVGVKDRVSEIGGFARGGQIPGAPSRADNRLAVGPAGLLKVASGEWINRTQSTLHNLPVLKRINSLNRAATMSDLVDVVPDGRARGGGVGDGIGDFFGKLYRGAKGLGEAVLNPKETATRVANAALARIPGAGMLVDFVRGSAKRLISSVGSWLGDKLGGFGIGNAGVAGGWKGMQRLIAARFPGLGLISGFRPGAVTVTGRPSYHGMGRAVDYPAIRALAAWIKSTFGAKTKELITPWQDLNLLNGKPHAYTGKVWQTHNFAGGNAHVHWAAALGGLIGRMTGMPVRLFDQGGAWPSGTVGMNLSGRTEYVDPNRRSGGVRNYYITNNVAPGGHPAEVGRQTVIAIKAYEAGSGKAWRTT